MVHLHTSPKPREHAPSSASTSNNNSNLILEQQRQAYYLAYNQDKRVIQEKQEAYYDYEEAAEDVDEDEYYPTVANTYQNSNMIGAPSNNGFEQQPDHTKPTFNPSSSTSDSIPCYGNEEYHPHENSIMRDDEEDEYVDDGDDHEANDLENQFSETGLNSSYDEMNENPYAKDSPQQEHYIEGVQFLLPLRYEPIECVGKGAYGIVISANDRLMNRKVAIKKIEAVFKKEKFFQKRIMREIKILIHCKGHPNIVEILDLVPPESFDEFEDIYIVTEYMDCNLQELLKSGQKFSEQNIQYFLYQMLKALDVLHSCDIVHRDIKSSNILVNNDYEVKFCDFGLSRAMMNEKMSTDNVATRWYRSPELLLKYHKAGKPIDVWSLGCVFAELLSTPKQHVLFPGESHLNQIDKILDILGTPAPEDIYGCFKAQVYMSNQPFRKKKDFSKLFPEANPEALDLLEKMLSFSPDKRITVKEALKHPYLESMANHMDDEEEGISSDGGFVTRDFEYRFDESWEVHQIKKMMYDECINFHSAWSRK
ncbi:hypothetical protein FDP41_001370 [Naegleria fowleri]|uniref:Protein kinase domain-containing protein n=1 Tax=Naegleria fowleri TaxID=5763 RepID=A0A6A5BYL8_NAEFO|nr:uncharacterized protein FDP41_001370 [Naegleria fowleri]KAF0979702.1 hypothetical protein FDP41_001370 [Naegleria fowleri]CAG4718773.1 unnamed protein product [Naegleria fowleri]